ncbi:unnamed protein product [Polarella glacialis]|uniref:Fe2OG dioxygenase domain-containing protein n=1 Tax=Polarella glacialis TaxID=89957 RepID=A0A813HEW3_POLGL|nr:unnamed protein product [Polarella glacialis]
MVQSWGIEMLRSGSGVMDVAGEPGFMACALLQRGIPVTVVDPSWAKTGKTNAYTQVQKVLEQSGSAKLQVFSEMFDEAFVAAHQDLVDDASAIVSLYGDQATSPCVHFAAKTGKPRHHALQRVRSLLSPTQQKLRRPRAVLLFTIFPILWDSVHLMPPVGESATHVITGKSPAPLYADGALERPLGLSLKPGTKVSIVGSLGREPGLGRPEQPERTEVVEVSVVVGQGCRTRARGWLERSKLHVLPQRIPAGVCASCHRALPPEASSARRAALNAKVRAMVGAARRRGLSFLPLASAASLLVAVATRSTIPLEVLLWSSLAVAILTRCFVEAERVSMHCYEPSLEERPLQLVGGGPQAASAWESCVLDIRYRSFASLRRCPFSEEDLSRWWLLAQREIPWERPQVLHGGLLPRSAAWFVGPGCTCAYEYNGTAWPATEMPGWLLEIQSSVWDVLNEGQEGKSLELPNSCVANFYADGSQSVDYHADNEPLFDGLAQDCRIISLSLGESRRFELRQRRGRSQDPSQREIIAMELYNGDLITMEGMFQKHWDHRVPRQREVSGPRINFTWRTITRHGAGCPMSEAEELDVTIPVVTLGSRGWLRLAQRVQQPAGTEAQLQYFEFNRSQITTQNAPTALFRLRGLAASSEIGGAFLAPLRKCCVPEKSLVSISSSIAMVESQFQITDATFVIAALLGKVNPRSSQRHGSLRVPAALFRMQKQTFMRMYFPTNEDKWLGMALGGTNAHLAIDEVLKAALLGAEGDARPRAVKVAVDVEGERLVCAGRIPRGDSLADTFVAVAGQLEESVPCLVLVHLAGDVPDTGDADWAMVAWTPGSSPVKLRMLCASSRKTLRSEFSSLRFKEHTATELDEVSLEQFLESTRPRTDGDRHAAMTQEELDADEVRKQVAIEQAAAPKMLAGLAALQVKVQPSFDESLGRLLAAPSGLVVVAQLCGASGEEVAAEVLEDVASPAGLRGKLPAAAPCYVMLCPPGPDASGPREGDEPESLQVTRLLLVSWLPDGAGVKARMKSSTFKASVVDRVRQLAGTATLVLAEATCEDDLDDSLLESASPPAAAVSSKAPVASSLPGAGGPRPPAGAVALPGMGRGPGGYALPGMGAAGLRAQLKPRQTSAPEMENQDAVKAEKVVVQTESKRKAEAVTESVATVAVTESVATVAAADGAVTGEFSLEELQTAGLWKDKDVVATERERYLPDATFVSLFGVSKDEFAKMPKWKRDNKKKEHGLF